MPHAYGYRSRTRDLFSRSFRRHGAPHLSTFLINYKIGDYVDIVGNGSAHKGMPYKFYHGRTGRVFNVNPNSIGVIVNKQIRNRIIHKRIHVRLEHLKKSTCLQDLKQRVKKNEEIKKAKKGEKNATLRRQPKGPRGELFIEGAKTEILFQNPEFHKEIF
jgi:large subunit ribosomal protein L21e